MTESMKGSPNLGFWILRCGFWIPGFCASGTWFLDYKQQDSGFLRMCSGFPKPRIPDSTANIAGFWIQSIKNFPDSVIRILFYGATLCNAKCKAMIWSRDEKVHLIYHDPLAKPIIFPGIEKALL